MHWISLIGFFIIVNICRSQPTTFKPFETGNTNKGGTLQVIPSGNNAAMYESKNHADGSFHVNTNIVPLERSMKSEKEGKNTVKFMTSNGNNNYCYVILPIIIAGFMSIIHF